MWLWHFHIWGSQHFLPLNLVYMNLLLPLGKIHKVFSKFYKVFSGALCKLLNPLVRMSYTDNVPPTDGSAALRLSRVHHCICAFFQEADISLCLCSQCENERRFVMEQCLCWVCEVWCIQYWGFVETSSELSAISLWPPYMKLQRKEQNWKLTPGPRCIK